ncbi:tenascin isoform X1 [Brachionus plicatilis]|uniref:Tenascin isoform X1 n=1 Tax=Brachionus plicatilis TaxID=10195 RepID=A0A3M7P8S6_BRAPC|nr:tenascin isoform X1 [Brachionus plicatilis]
MLALLRFVAILTIRSVLAWENDTVSEHKVVDFDKSLIIVWELSGLNSRSEITTIFQSNIGKQNNITVSFNPFIRSVIFETDINNNKNITQQIIQSKNDIKILFFMFNKEGSVTVLVDCPKINQIKKQWKSDYVPMMTKIHLYKNTHSFSSIDSASLAFKCKDSIDIEPGTIVHFTGKINSIGTLIFSFEITNRTRTVIYSFSFINGEFQVISSDDQILYIPMYGSINDSFFLLFTTDGVEIYADCPSVRYWNGFWPVSFFNNSIRIETFITFEKGNGKSYELLFTFCTVNNLSQIINENKAINSYNSAFLPSHDQATKLDEFFLDGRFPFGYLMRPVHRVLIASRENAQPSFFYRSINDYVEGFSDGKNNFWIGLDILNYVTDNHNYALRIEAENGELVEEYKVFKVGNRSLKYRLTVSEPFDQNVKGFLRHNGLEFSAYNFGSYSSQAVKFNAFFWLKSDTNYFCFSCENGVENGASYSNVIEFGIDARLNNYGYNRNQLSKIKTIKMFLLP